MTISVDLGSGPVPKNPFGADEVYGVDIYDTGVENVLVADLILDPLPFEDSSVDYVVCTDFLEHIPRMIYVPEYVWNGYSDPVVKPVRKQPFIDVMSEVWRILKPGGQFYAKTPAIPESEAFQDPTHVNFITENTQDYFAGGLVPLCQAYGFKGEFRLLEQNWENFWLVWHMEAVK